MPVSSLSKIGPTVGCKTGRWARLLLLAAGALALVAGTAHAQSAAGASGSGASYVTPFPPGDTYALQVYGDTFAEGLLQGLGETVSGEDRVDVARKPRSIAQLVRAEFEDDIRAEELSRDVVHVGVVTIGFGDRGTLRAAGGKSASFGTAAWKDQYGQRVDRLLKALKRRNIALYVVGLPPLRRSEASADAAVVNETLLERSLANGVRFIDATDSFTDEAGAFTQFGLDTAGNRNKLRDGDGVGFTQAGYRKLASLVAIELKRDLAAARAERAVPLAGGESEQRRINPDKAAALPAVTAPRGIAAAGARDGRPQPASQATITPGATAATGQLGQKAESSRIVLRFPSLTGREETSQQIELVRPAVPAAVIALLTRKETVEAAQQPFDLLIDDVGDGVSVTTMVTATSDGAAAAGRRRGPNALAAYSTVWVKGERLESKLGRADDFSWPRPDAVVFTAPAAAPQAPPARTQQGRRR